MAYCRVTAIACAFIACLSYSCLSTLSFARSPATLKMASSPPLIIGLNAALQRTVSCQAVVKGAVNRAQSMRVGIGGKGQNAAAAGKIMADNIEGLPRPQLLQFLGKGFEGDQLMQLMHAAGITTADCSDLDIRYEGRCRTCVTLLDVKAGDATEIIEPSDPVGAADVQAMLKALRVRYGGNRASTAVALMGSMPPGCPAEFYAQIVSAVCDPSSKVLIDTVAGLSATLAACAGIGCETVLKLNARELCSVAGVDISHITRQSESAVAVPIESLLAAADKLFSFNSGLTYIACTDGKFPASFLHQNGEAWRILVPILPRPLISPIGAGDTVAAGTLLRWSSVENGADGSRPKALAAFLWGLACGSASCLTSLNADFAIADAHSILSSLQVQKIQR
jgi:1-phosphofructokinase